MGRDAERNSPFGPSSSFTGAIMSAVDYFIYAGAIIVKTCKSLKTFRLGSVGGQMDLNSSRPQTSTAKKGRTDYEATSIRCRLRPIALMGKTINR